MFYKLYEMIDANPDYYTQQNYLQQLMEKEKHDPPIQL